MQGFEPVAVGIDDKGCEIIRAIVGADARLAIVPAAGGQGCGVKPRDAVAIGRFEAKMQSGLWIVRHGRVGEVDPEEDRLLLAVAKRILALAEAPVADRLER